ncbi:YbbR-like domain-containing protein [candidate division KSB1 bacterium]|nr:YbbR-like domain-containing protein [candidate division KSB1 bacterium]
MTPKRHLFEKEKRFWSQYKAKVAATVFAFVIWFFIVTGGTFEYKTTIPIFMPSLHKEFIITSPAPPPATIRVSGQGRNLISFLLFKQARLVPEIDWTLGSKTTSLSKENIQLFGITKRLDEIELLEPHSIQIEIEKLVIRELPIKNMIKFKPLAGHTIVGAIEVDPDKVSIQGPRSMVSKYDSIKTASILWDHLKYTIEKNVDLIPPDNELIKLLTTRTQIYADVQKLMEKRISNVPVKVINLPPQTSALVIPSHISLMIEGGVKVVSEITAEDIVAYIDYKRHLDNKDNDYLAFIEEIPGIRPRDFEPKKFKVVLERK